MTTAPTEQFPVLVKLMTLIRKHGLAKNKGLRPAVCKYQIAGIKLSLEKMWFMNPLLTKYRLAGNRWSVIVTLSKHPGNPDAYVEFDGELWYLLEMHVSGHERMERDLVLLRMFGVETIFSGQA